MAKRPTQLDKAIQKIDDQMTVLAHAREVLVAQRIEAERKPATVKHVWVGDKNGDLDATPHGTPKSPSPDGDARGRASPRPTTC